MKSTTPSKISKFVMAIAIASTAALATQSAYAAAIAYDLVLTENSPTSLSLAYTGPGGSSSFSVLNTSPDNWTITILSQTISFTDFEYDFAEPEDPLNNTVNVVSHSTDVQSNMLFVQSNLPIALDNGGEIGTNDVVGQDGGVPIVLSFNDGAAASEAATGVPDTGSTLGLLALSATALLSLSRLPSLRSANQNSC